MKEPTSCSGCSSYAETLPHPWDPTIIPDTQVFYHAPIALTPTTVETRRGEDGVYSHDPTLDYDAEELWRFLLSNLDAPRLSIHLVGTHMETRTRTVTSTTAEGATTTRTEDYTEAVTDFDFHVDVSQYVLPEWRRLVAQPATVRATLEEYASSRNAFKELRCEKRVEWDYDRVTHLLRSSLDRCLRGDDDDASGPGRSVAVRVAFPRQEWKVSALASNWYSRAAHSTLVQVLCAVTCLWIVFWPAWAIARKRMKNRLACEYEMAVSADEFYSRNWFLIRSAMMQRCRGEHLVAL